MGGRGRGRDREGAAEGSDWEGAEGDVMRFMSRASVGPFGGWAGERRRRKLRVVRRKKEEEVRAGKFHRIYFVFPIDVFSRKQSL